MLAFTKHFLILGWNLALCAAVVYESFSELQSEEFDFVIIGGENV